MVVHTDDPAGLPGFHGAYLLVLTVERDFAVTFEGLGRQCFVAGRYLYLGGRPAGPGPAPAVARHLDGSKPVEHPLDRLTAAAVISAAAGLPGGDPCRLADILRSWPGMTPAVPDFPGDAPCACPAHLLVLPEDFDPAATGDLLARGAGARDITLWVRAVDDAAR